MKVFFFFYNYFSIQLKIESSTLKIVKVDIERICVERNHKIADIELKTVPAIKIDLNPKNIQCFCKKEKLSKFKIYLENVSIEDTINLTKNRLSYSLNDLIGRSRDLKLGPLICLVGSNSFFCKKENELDYKSVALHLLMNLPIKFSVEYTLTCTEGTVENKSLNSAKMIKFTPPRKDQTLFGAEFKCYEGIKKLELKFSSPITLATIWNGTEELYNSNGELSELHCEYNGGKISCYKL